jgi:hypothetical protein
MFYVWTFLIFKFTFILKNMVKLNIENRIINIFYKDIVNWYVSVFKPFFYQQFVDVLCLDISNFQIYFYFLF